MYAQKKMTILCGFSIISEAARLMLSFGSNLKILFQWPSVFFHFTLICATAKNRKEVYYPVNI